MKFESLADGKSYEFFGVCDNCFKLDDTVWEAVEDEVDGYRSMLDEIRINNDPTLIFSKHALANVVVETIDDPDMEIASCFSTGFQGFRIVDDTGHVWLMAGTADYNDYYPCFWFEYRIPSAE